MLGDFRSSEGQCQHPAGTANRLLRKHSNPLKWGSADPAPRLPPPISKICSRPDLGPMSGHEVRVNSAPRGLYICVSRIHSKDAGIVATRGLQYVQLHLEILTSGAHPGAADQLSHAHSLGLSVRNMKELLRLHFLRGPDETEMCRLPRVSEAVFPGGRQMQRLPSGSRWRPHGYWPRPQESKLRTTYSALQGLASGLTVSSVFESFWEHDSLRVLALSVS